MEAAVQELQPDEVKLDPDRVIEVDTEVGPLWLERDARILTPTVLSGGRWEPRVTDLLTRLLRPGMTVIDAGANVGYISVHASRLVGPTGRVFCVEADPANVAILRANLWRNGCTNAKVLPVAAWFERADLDLKVVPEGGACTHVASGGSGDSTVAGHRLDEIIDGPVDYLKIDCEGTDHLVLTGAAGLFRDNPGLVATVEFVPDRDTHTGHSAHEILGIYEGMGLRPFLVSEGGRLRPTSYARIQGSGAQNRLVSYDFALSPRRPARLVLSHHLDAPRRGWERLLRLGGDLLEHVPAALRPKIRRRDRRPGG